MTIKNTVKICAVLGYLCLVVYVPEMPNYYTFSVDVLAFSSTSAASGLLLQFLNTRPVAQKNLLNRKLAVFVLFLFLGSTRNFSMALTTCFFHAELQRFVDVHPSLAASFLSMRLTAVMACFSVLALCAGRLLLFANPVYFHNLNPIHGTILTVLLNVLLVGVDLVYSWVTCYSHADDPENKIIINFRTEMGLVKHIQAVNISTLHQMNNTESELEETNCKPLPSIEIFLGTAVLLEGAKLIVVLIRKIKTLTSYGCNTIAADQPHSISAVLPAPTISLDADALAHSDPVYPTSSPSTLTAPADTVFPHPRSFTLIPRDSSAHNTPVSNPSSPSTSQQTTGSHGYQTDSYGCSGLTPVTSVASSSSFGPNLRTAYPFSAGNTLPPNIIYVIEAGASPPNDFDTANHSNDSENVASNVVAALPTPSSTAAKAPGKKAPTRNTSSNNQETSLERMYKALAFIKNIMITLYIRTGSIITIGFLIALAVTIGNSYGIHTTSFIVVAGRRFIFYSFIVILVSFDKDCIQYLKEKLNMD